MDTKKLPKVGDIVYCTGEICLNCGIRQMEVKEVDEQDGDLLLEPGGWTPLTSVFLTMEEAKKDASMRRQKKIDRLKARRQRVIEETKSEINRLENLIF